MDRIIKGDDIAMTSTFDDLSVLFFDSTREQRIPQDLVLLVFAEAVKEISAVAPEKITWDRWVNSGGVYARLYREKASPLIEAQANFISHCHIDTFWSLHSNFSLCC